MFIKKVWQQINSYTKHIDFVLPNRVKQLVFRFLVKHTVLSNIFKILNQKIREPKSRNVAKMSNSNS